MTGGIIVGGWEYVIAAYCITFAVLGSYTASVFFRLRGERKSGQEKSK
jgi:hypothetical protein